MQPIPKKVVLDLTAHKLFIDGDEFPWLITEEPGVAILANSDGIPTCTVTFFADSVEVRP